MKDFPVNYPIVILPGRHLAAVLLGMVILGVPSMSNAQPLPSKTAVAAPAPDLDLTIHYYSRVLTDEGVLRESRYQESMLRRAGHVWTSRVLVHQSKGGHAAHGAEGKHGHGKAPVVQSASVPQPKRHGQHKHFNPTTLPRHLTLESGKIRLEYVDLAHKEVIAIMPSDYENVGFDGSWANAYSLIDPQAIAAMPLAKKVSPVPGAKWRELARNGVFQRVLWDEKNKLALIMETGNSTGTIFNRIEAKLQASASNDLPWKNLKGYAQKEYADFLD